MGIESYKPSKTIAEMNRDGRLYPCKGLKSIVAAARAEGWTVLVDFEDYLEEVTAPLVRQAVHEMDETRLIFSKAGERRCWMLVIPENDGDWLCDYSVAPWLEEIIKSTNF